MAFKLYVLTVLIPLNGTPTNSLTAVDYQTPCFHLEKLLSGETVIDSRTQLRVVTKARCVPDQGVVPPTGYGVNPNIPQRQYTPDDPDDPLHGYDPLRGIVPIR